MSCVQLCGYESARIILQCRMRWIMQSARQIRIDRYIHIITRISRMLDEWVGRYTDLYPHWFPYYSLLHASNALRNGFLLPFAELISFFSACWEFSKQFSFFFYLLVVFVLEVKNLFFLLDFFGEPWGLRGLLHRFLKEYLYLALGAN